MKTISSNTWQIEKLENVCDLVRGTEPGSNSYFNEPAKNCIHFIRVGDITGKVDNPKFVSKKLNSLTMVKPDDILISFDGTPGVVTRGWSGAISSGIRAVRNIKRDEILKDFLFYYLQTPPVQEAIRFYTTGVTILHASRAIPHVKIEIPPLPIQQKIVERLDAIKKAQDLNEKQIELAKELFKSLLHKELNPEGKSWTKVTLDKVLKLVQYGLSVKMNTERKGYKIFRMNNIIDGKMDDDDIKYVDINVEEFRKFKLEKYDVLINRVNSYELVGKVGIFDLDGDYTFASYLIRLRGKENTTDQKYLNYFLNSQRSQKQIKRKARQAVSQANINAKEIASIKVPLPSLGTQRKIVEKLSAVQDYKKKLLDQKQKLQELFASVLNKSFKENYV